MVTYKSIEPFVLGGVSACNVDLVKTRLQIQGQKLGNVETKYGGMFHCMRTVFKEEGVKALYSGIKPAFLRQATYGTLKIGFYQYMKSAYFSLSQTTTSKESLVVNILCGMVSGASSNALANPTDLLKVRMQSDEKSFRNKAMHRAFVEIYQKEGLTGLYRGVYPNAQRAAIITGAELASYDTAKDFLVNRIALNDGLLTHFMASSLAGLLAAIFATPIDVIKTRIMNQKRLLDNTNADNIYKGSIDCFLKTVRNEGFMALYKGFWPSYLRLGPWNVIFFLTYEGLKVK